MTTTETMKKSGKMMARGERGSGDGAGRSEMGIVCSAGDIGILAGEMGEMGGLS
jgi:hypothetical protein